MKINLSKERCLRLADLEGDHTVAAGALPPTNCSASSIREKVETERWFFIADYCKKKGISPMHDDNFNRAAMEWAKLNCFEPDVESDHPESKS